MKIDIENKCSECLFWKTGDCPNGQGVVIWKNCKKFKLPISKQANAVQNYKKKLASRVWQNYFSGRKEKK